MTASQRRLVHALLLGSFFAPVSLHAEPISQEVVGAQGADRSTSSLSALASAQEGSRQGPDPASGPETRQQDAAVSSASSEGQSAQAEPGTGGIQDIVITASRREQRLQDVPISVTAISGEDLVEQGITQSFRLPQVVPGLIIARNTTIVQPSIRGVGSRAATQGDESNVAIYIDGVYQPTTYTGAFDLLKVARVEVLRGPQGTLFGRNSTGGLINIITPDPQFQFGGEATIRLGNFGERSAQAYVTGPLSSTLAFDAAGMIYRDHGFVRDLNTGNRTADRRNVAGRAKLLFQPLDTARTVLTMSFMRMNDRSALAVQPLNNQTIGRSRGATNLPTKPWESSLSFEPEGRIRQLSLSSQTHFDLNELNLDIVTAYQKDSLRSRTDSDASNANVQSVENASRSHNVSQEIRLSSGNGGRLTWILGGYGFRAVARYDPIQVFSGTVPVSVQFAKNVTESLAGFAEGTLEVVPSLSVTAGARYTYERRHFTAVNRNTVNTARVDAETSFGQFTPRVIAKYDIAPRANIYASFSRGFKSGVFNTGGRSPIPVAPEKISAYEAGLKADPLSWLRTNLSAFYYDYQDIQLSQRDPNGVSILQNAGVARMKGAELEVTAQVTPEFNLRMAGSLLDAKFKKFLNAVVTVPLPTGGNSQIGIDAARKDAIRSPSYTLNLSGTYERDFASGTLALSGGVFFSDGYFWDYLNRLRQPQFALVNAQASWTFGAQKVRITLYGDNLTNEAVESNVVTSTLGDYTSYQRPRSYGISISKEF